MGVGGWGGGGLTEKLKKVSVSKINLRVFPYKYRLLSTKIENDFLCMDQIIWLVVQIIYLFNWRNWRKMILPATDGKNFFDRVYFKIMLLFSLLFNLKSYYF